jgi:hypothetical protein
MTLFDRFMFIIAISIVNLVVTIATSICVKKPVKQCATKNMYGEIVAESQEVDIPTTRFREWKHIREDGKIITLSEERLQYINISVLGLYVPICLEIWQWFDKGIPFGCCTTIIISMFYMGYSYLVCKDYWDRVKNMPTSITRHSNGDKSFTY